jgi:hypothetical protein
MLFPERRGKKVHPKFTDGEWQMIVVFFRDSEYLNIMTHELYANNDKRRQAFERLAALLKGDYQ